MSKNKPAVEKKQMKAMKMAVVPSKVMSFNKVKEKANKMMLKKKV